MSKKTKKRVKKSTTSNFIEKKIPELLLVEWKDHWSNAAGWNDTTKIDLKPVIIRTAGYNVSEDRETLVLAQTISDTNQFSNVFGILKNCIVKKTKL